MKRILWMVVAMLCGAVPVTAQVELDTSKIYLWSGGSSRGVIQIGSGAPSGGDVGDQWMDYTTGKLYVKKSAGWIELVGYDAQTANTVLAGPTTGGAAAATFRALVAADIPGTLNATIFAGHVTPNTTDTYDLGSPTKLWNRGYLSEMHAVLFAKETQSLYGGWLTVTKNAGTFPAAVSSGATSINFGQTMTTNQFVVVRAADTGGTITAEYMKVGSLVSGTTYNVSRNLSGAGAKNWAAGTPYAVRGVSGDGWLELNAYDTPRLSLFTQGTLYNNSTEGIRLGHLTGMPNSSSGIGIYMGDATNYFRWDGSTIKFVTAGATLDSAGITVGAGAGAYDVTGAYKFNRPTGGSFGTFGQTGDRFGVTGVANTLTNHDLAIENVMKGLASGAGGGTGNARVVLTAQGWDAGGAGASTTASTFYLQSQPSGAGVAGAYLSVPRFVVSTDGTLPLGTAGEFTIEAPVVTTSTITERSRATPIGEWIDVAHNAANFTASAGTWTVDLADQVTYTYTLVGKTMTVAFEIFSTDVSTGGQLRIAVPGGFTIATQMRAPIFVSDAGATTTVGIAYAVPATQYITLYATANVGNFGATSSDNTTVTGTFTFEVQ